MIDVLATGSFQGWDAPSSTDVERRAAVDAAFDYRGDVTLTLCDGHVVTGFVSNRDFTATEPFLELFAVDHLEPQTIPLDSITAIRFSGSDAAAGKSWDLWLKKVALAETEGRIAELYPEES
nr:hypothetical protein Hi04_10k_c2220_00012 [uncultured bacterium]